MTVENQDTGIGIAVPGETAPETQFSALETDAMSRGWVPEDQWVDQGHESDGWVDAKTFVERGKLMDVISKQSKKLKKMEKAIEDFKGLYNTVKEKTAAEAREQLLAEKTQHMENGDYRKAVEVDEKLKEVATAEKQEPTKVADPYIEYFDDVWIGKNSWYNDSTRMRLVADEIGAKYFSSNKDSSPEEVFEYVDQQIRKEFPDKFGRARPTSGKVDASNRSGKPNTTGKSALDRLHGLSEDERRVGKRFVEAGAFKSLDEYAADLAKHGL